MAEAGEGGEGSEESTNSFVIHSKLPDNFQIPRGYSVCSKKQDGLWVFSKDAESFFKEHAIDWNNIKPYESSRKGSIMSALIDGIVGEGISLNSILKRCVHVKIRQSSFFGVLNSTFNPSGTEAGVPTVPTHMTDSISFVILIHQGNIERKFKEFVDLIVNVLRNEVNFQIIFHIFYVIILFSSFFNLRCHHRVHLLHFSATAETRSYQFLNFFSPPSKNCWLKFKIIWESLTFLLCRWICFYET